MKRRLAGLALTILLALVPLAALADVPATPNQRLYLRTGPAIEYFDIGHMPETTALTAIEYEFGSSVTWVLVEYEHDGQLERGYTGLKRMTVHGDIPWANHLFIDTTITRTATVYSGPGDYYLFRSSLTAGTPVTLLRFEDGFAYIDFSEGSTGQLSRGWVRSGSIAYSDGSDWYDDGWDGWDSNEDYTLPYESMYGTTFSNGTLVYVTDSYGALMYDAPGGNASLLCVIPSGSVIESLSTTGNGYLLVRYGDWMGFVRKSKLTLY